MKENKDNKININNIQSNVGAGFVSARGITMIVLVITMIVLLILVGVVIYLVSSNGPIEQAKYAKFATEFREIEERVELYITDKEIEEEVKKIQITNRSTRRLEKIEESKMPVLSIVTSEEKEEIKKKKPTLQTKMEELSGKSIDEMNVYWIDQEKIQTNQKSRYIIDIDTRQIYQYEGKKIFGKMWHTLDEGVEEGRKTESEEDIWNGWIKLILYYPAGATEKQWRLGEEGETRYDKNLMWQNYTGPIIVRLSDVENVWIKYKMNGEEVIIPPTGKILVDIQPDSYYPTPAKDNKVTIKIAYEKDADLKQYKIGNSDWMDYEGEFVVTENTIVEARARKIETISDNEGNEIGTRERWGRDNIYVGNIGIEEDENLPAPTITRKTPTEEGEKAKIEITYPEQANKKIYKINYGTEQQYTDQISIKNYGTYVVAYYYNAEGKRSKSKAIYIGETDTPAADYTPNRPGKPGTGGSTGGSTGTNPTTPSYQVPAPNINVNPTTVANSVQVSITAPYGYIADTIYYKIGNGTYQKYTNPITITSNTKIKAYYVTAKGENSQTATKRINNIQEPNMPYIKIEADPDPDIQKYDVNQVTVTITSQDADTTQYSYNGVEYTNYTEPITVTKNCRIYAKGTNENGSTVEYIDITNIGNKAPEQKQKLNVQIQVTPEPELTTGQVEKATVTIEYDQRATSKYYKIGKNGTLTQYTGAIEISMNSTIYAYAISNNGYGETNKKIDHLTNGISDPKITATPGNSKQAQTVKVKIEYDKNATITRYKIDGGNYTDYTGEIEITNNCTITAYNKNKKGDEATSKYKITNITKTTTVILDQGEYYLIKLNYPPNTTGRQYKWQENGEWKNYNEQGILLIKPQYKDKILDASGNVKIKIKDETGKEITFTGDYYFVTQPIQQLMESISMRWDRTTPEAPQIILNTNEPARQVTANIIYNSTLIVKQYKIVEPNGRIGDWQEYTGPIVINKNNTIIYVRGQDDAEVWSNSAMKKITNIDEQPPEIKITADLDSPKQKVGIKVEAIDDVRVETVMWAKGIQKDSYFNSQGNVIQNNSVFNVEENGYYTIYAKDGVGNTSTYTIQVDNIDKNAPNIDIQITPESTITTEVTIKIEYGDSQTKQYKIGENGTWTTYTKEINLTSNTVISKGWKNSDNTVTIYAKGTDTSGNSKTIDKKILSLDVDAPQLPVINSNYGYPILTEYGIQFDGETTITYDTRNDIDNYYSIDNGTTWQKYTGSFNMPGAGTIKAKSVKKSSGLEVIATRTISMPGNALTPTAYDGNEGTNCHLGVYGTMKYLYISEEMIGKKLYYSVSTFNRSYMIFYNSNGTEISRATFNSDSSYANNITIPEGAIKLGVTGTNFRIKEIQTVNKPTISETQHYPLLTQYGVDQGYCTATISYFPTSVQKLYKIGNGDWKTYNGQTIRLELGQILYAKGIDKNRTETNVVSYTATLPGNALTPTAYDRNEGTNCHLGVNGTMKYVYISEEMIEKQMYYSVSTFNRSYMIFYNSNGTEISRATFNSDSGYARTIKVPEGTIRVGFTGTNLKVREVRPAN